MTVECSDLITYAGNDYDAKLMCKIYANETRLR